MADAADLAADAARAAVTLSPNKALGAQLASAVVADDPERTILDIECSLAEARRWALLRRREEMSRRGGTR